MKMIHLILLVFTLILSSCGGENPESKISNKIIEECSKELDVKLLDGHKDVKEKVYCKELHLILSLDEEMSKSNGCSNAIYFCLEKRYNYKMTFNGKEYPERVPYYLVQNALGEVDKRNKVSVDSFFKE